MKLSTFARRSLVGLLCFGVLLPQMAQAAAPMPANSRNAVVDVALQPGGTFCGQVVNNQGAPLADSTIWIARGGQLITAAQTDADGRFAARGLQGGVYQVVTANEVTAFRLWAENTAPPAANQKALLVSDENVVRGQWPGLGLFGNPWVVGILIAAAIAIPLALDDGPSSS